MKNIINWFEIPVSDFERARKFYESVLGSVMHTENMGGYQMGFFPHEANVSGAIVHGEGYSPSTSGTLIYFDCNPDLQQVLDRIEPAGGKVLVPKTVITPEIGYFARILDTEGNMLALHSSN